MHFNIQIIITLDTKIKMKNILFFLVFLSTTTLFAQKKKQIDSLNFCSYKYKVPVGCKAESEYQISCDEYSMVWLYMNEEMFKANIPDQFINSLKSQTNDFKKAPLEVYLLKQKVQGYKISFKTANGEIKYQIWAIGTINTQPVLVQLSLSTEPKNNNEIPDFPRQIITLTN